MNDETSVAVIPERIPRRRWTQTDGEHYRALVRATTESLAVLDPTPRRRVTDPVTVQLHKGPRTVRPCSRRHRTYVLSGLLPVSCTKCRLDPPEGAEQP